MDLGAGTLARLVLCPWQGIRSICPRVNGLQYTSQPVEHDAPAYERRGLLPRLSIIRSDYFLGIAHSFTLLILSGPDASLCQRIRFSGRFQGSLARAYQRHVTFTAEQVIPWPLIAILAGAIEVAAILILILFILY